MQYDTDFAAFFNEYFKTRQFEIIRVSSVTHWYYWFWNKEMNVEISKWTMLNEEIGT